jgi:hypothetical protein
MGYTQYFLDYNNNTHNIYFRIAYFMDYAPYKYLKTLDMVENMLNINNKNNEYNKLVIITKNGRIHSTIGIRTLPKVKFIKPINIMNKVIK